MITRITLKNFQIHKDVSLELGSGITAIIGDSDKGKSSILRALRWVSLNDPSGDEFINDDAAFCSVEIEKDGNTIVRYKDKKVNQYILNGTVYNTVGTGVPKEVQDALGLTEVNFQMQDDPFFLIGISNAGDVSKKLNEVVGLNTITLSNSYPTKIIRSETIIGNQLRKDLKEKERSLKKYHSLDSLETKVQEWETKKEKLEKLSRKIHKLGSLVQSLTLLRSKLTDYKQISIINQKLYELSLKEKSFKKKQIRAADLKEIIQNITQNQKKAWLSKFIQEKVNPIHEKFKVKVTAQSNLVRKQNQIKSLITKIESSKEEVASTEQKIKDIKNKVNQLKQKLGTCPTCGKPFEKEE